jgi:hypothetical protein
MLPGFIGSPGGRDTSKRITSDCALARTQLLNQVAVLWNPDNPGYVKEMESIKEAARSLGLDLTVFPVTPKEIDASFAAIANGGFSGIVVPTDPSLETLAPQVADAPPPRADDARQHAPAAPTSNALTSAFISIGWLRTEDQEGECYCQYGQCG